MASSTYYFTLSEFVEQKNSFADKNVKVSGNVTDTIERQGSTLKFTLTDGNNSLPVIYTGVVPDTFKAGGEAVVEGKLNPDGVFEARNLLAKCASKYEPAGAPAASNPAS